MKKTIYVFYAYKNNKKKPFFKKIFFNHTKLKIFSSNFKKEKWINYHSKYAVYKIY